MKNDLPFAHLLILILLLFISVNLFILDLKIFYPGNYLATNIMDENSPVREVNVSPVPSPQGLSFCPASCLSYIDQATSSSRTGNASQASIVPPSETKTDKEYFIPLGNGATQKNDWDNLVATETVINPSVYGIFKEAYFIVSLKNPTQNGQTEVRLYNVTDNNVVYGSHLQMNGPLEQTITSPKFPLPLASKLYRVQLKSTLSYPVSLENARLKLIAS